MAIFIRIILRYLAGLLMAKGLLAPEAGIDLFTDPDIEMAIQLIAGAVAAAVSEGWYFLARRFGWAK